MKPKGLLFMGIVGIYSITGFASPKFFHYRVNLPIVLKSILPSRTNTPTQPPVQTPQPTPSVNCDPSYPTVCIPPPPPDLDCGDIP